MNKLNDETGQLRSPRGGHVLAERALSGAGLDGTAGRTGSDGAGVERYHETAQGLIAECRSNYRGVFLTRAGLDVLRDLCAEFDYVELNPFLASGNNEAHLVYKLGARAVISRILKMLRDEDGQVPVEVKGVLL